MPEDVAATDALEDGHERNVDPVEVGAKIYRDHGLNLEDIDDDAIKVVSRLNRYGFQAYMVGGCVRDLLCGLKPKDFDIATSATPRQIKRLFSNSRIIGRRFRLVHIHFGHHILEVSTFRSIAPKVEGEDLLIRRDNVFGRADEDAQRRDFTINALFYDAENHEVIDFVGGMKDLRRRRIEIIGDPETRLREDPVRMLRAAKFAGRLDFELADDLFDGIREVREDLRKCAPPRLYEEVQRLLGRGGAEGAFEVLYDTRLLDVLLPEIYDLVESEDFEIDGQVISPSRAFWSGLKALDRLEREGRDVSSITKLGVLFCHMFDRSLQHQGPLPRGRGAAALDLSVVAEDQLRPLSMRLQIPRRELYRLKQILLALRRLIAHPITKTKQSGRKKPSPAQFMKKEYFPDSFRLFQIYSKSCGRWQGEVAEWERRFEDIHGHKFL
ncbi:MAG: polynucleotide adenylyltransferase PcnB [Planctomycetota bacterium]